MRWEKKYTRMYIINECEMHKIEFNYLLKLQHFNGSLKEIYLYWEQFRVQDFKFIYSQSFNLFTKDLIFIHIQN